MKAVAEAKSAEYPITYAKVLTKINKAWLSPGGAMESFVREYGKAFAKAGLSPDLAGFQSFKIWEWVKNVAFLKEIGFLQPNILLKAFYVIKQLMTGLSSPTEWVELAYFIVFDRQLDIGNKYWNLLWNWGDNFYLLFMSDESTLGFFKAIGWNPWLLSPYHDEFGANWKWA